MRTYVSELTLSRTSHHGTAGPILQTLMIVDCPGRYPEVLRQERTCPIAARSPTRLEPFASSQLHGYVPAMSASAMTTPLSPLAAVFLAACAIAPPLRITAPDPS